MSGIGRLRAEVRPSGRRAVAAALVASLVACGGGGAADDGAGATPTVETSPALAEPLADAVKIDAAVDVALAGDDFAAVDDEPAPVAVGDVVRTDDAGFAEIAYFDGSVVRLDVDTTLEIVALSDSAGEAEIVTRMDLGRTWNRVADDVPDRTYSVETNVATATVRGTVFVVDCPAPDRCTFTVLEGSVEITPTGGDPILLEAPGALEVLAGEEPTEVPVVGPDDDPWLARNAARDAEADGGASAGASPPSSLLPTDGPDGGIGASGADFEALEGEWTATASGFEVVQATGRFAGATFSAEDPAEPMFDGDDWTHTFHVLHGPARLGCSPTDCNIQWELDSFGETRTASLTLNDGPDGPRVAATPTCAGVEFPPDTGVVDELSADRFTFPFAIEFSDDDCAGVAVVTLTITMERS